MAVRRRLSVEERRRELIEIGMELFSTQPYEDVWIEEVAERAGISRGLLYHYFPTKRDFYVTVARAAASDVWRRTAPQPGLPAREQVRVSLDEFLRAATERPHGFLTAYRGALAGDPEVRSIVETARDRQAERIVRGFAAEGVPGSALTRLATRGWIAFVQDVTARWLRSRRPPLEDVRDMLVRALEGAFRES